ncbi:hypothetical protein BCV72DRAFT_216904 [Rhizopus microsporus var. microsporus]|uniref:Endonuclease/exonuclease/phosphatase domain-containing protein n=1 Tax=Rhizopus microsporus var. microsporus TaxID=86635 RepID=A0A1X0QPF4_RHIZD|nr:hypothetical protein BCV72DRAFT_216904 [Rhizopus microsporus var. microsporus]
MINTTYKTNNKNGSSEHIFISSTNSKNSSCRSNFSIDALNCRGLRKTANPATSAEFICYLRTVSLDIIALQEAHANTDEIAQFFNIQFQANTSYWSNYCSIVCFSPFLSFSEPTWDTTAYTNC